MEVNFLNQNPCIPPWPGVFQYGTFFNVVLNDSGVYPPHSLLWLLVILISCCLSTFEVFMLLLKEFQFLETFCYILPVRKFNSKNVVFFLFPLLLIYPYAFFTYLLADFSFLILEYPVLLDPVPVSFKSPFLLTMSFDLSLKLHRRICLLSCFWLSVPVNPHVFILPKHFYLLLQFLYLSFLPNFLSRFCFSVQVPAQSVSAVEYTECVSSKGQDFLNECLGYEWNQAI